MKLKIGRHEYDITPKDTFMDNGTCVQLLTQSKETSQWGQRSSPVLSKVAIKKINQFDRMPVEHKYGTPVEVFSRKL